MLNAAWVFVGGALGAVARLRLSGWVAARTGGALPWGTLAVNLLGCFLLGVAAGISADWGASWVLLVEVGFIGALTTFSTLSYETLRLLEEGFGFAALLNPLGNLAGGLVLLVLGVTLGSALK